MFGFLHLAELTILVASGATGLQRENGKLRGNLKLEIPNPSTP